MYSMQGYYDIAHGNCLAILLSACMRYTFQLRQERFYSLGKNVFDEKMELLPLRSSKQR